MSPEVKCLDDVFDRRRPHSQLNAGLRAIEVRRITGTVDKCGELNAKFQQKNRASRLERSRRSSMRQAYEHHALLPPISVYLYRGEYFVIDGNRRVAAAIDRNMEFIDAEVTELIDKTDILGSRGAMSRRRFESETGLTGVQLTYEIGYRTLLDDISAWAGRDAGREGARRWYTERYLPALARIRRRRLNKAYPGLRSGDLFCMIVDFYDAYTGGQDRDIDFDTLISGFLFAHGIGEKKTLRRAVRRMLGALLVDRGVLGAASPRGD